MALMEIQQLSLAGRLDGISLNIMPGEVMGLIGPNGAGKSSLMHCMGNVITPHSGQMVFDNRPLQSLDLQDRARRIGLLPQRVSLAWALDVRSVVALGRIPWRDEKPASVHRAMAMMDTLSLADRRVDRLSGGEQARVALARVLAGEPQLLLADEPVASLDLHHQLGVMGMLRDYAEQGCAVMVALHDLSLAARFCDRLCLLHEGRVLASGDNQIVLTRENLLQAYRVETKIDLQHQPPIVMAE